jgi:RNA-dependent RNA polymerase
MEVEIKLVPFDSSQYDVTKAIAQVLHNEIPKLATGDNERKVNFKVTLEEGIGGVRNNGKGRLFTGMRQDRRLKTSLIIAGTLVLPSRRIGQIFLDWVHQEDNFIQVDKKKLKFYPTHGKTRYLKELKMILEKAPYVDPEIDEQRQIALSKLDRSLRVDEVQFGIICQPKGRGPLRPRVFSIEWSRSYEESLAMLRFEYDHKLIRIEVCPSVLYISSTF